eukprot:263525-Rhodomonas_salina.1
MVALMKGTSPLATSIRQHPSTRLEASRSVPSSGRTSRLSSGRVSRFSSGRASRLSQCEGQLEELIDEGRQLISEGDLEIPKVENGQLEERLMQHMGLREGALSRALDDMEETEPSESSKNEVAVEDSGLSGSGYSDCFDDDLVVTRPQDADMLQVAEDAKLPEIPSKESEQSDATVAQTISLPIEDHGAPQTEVQDKEVPDRTVLESINPADRKASSMHEPTEVGAMEGVREGHVSPDPMQNTADSVLELRDTVKTLPDLKVGQAIGHGHDPSSVQDPAEEEVVEDMVEGQPSSDPIADVEAENRDIVEKVPVPDVEAGVEKTDAQGRGSGYSESFEDEVDVVAEKEDSAQLETAQDVKEVLEKR